MIDMFSLVVSLGMTALVVFFAIKLNRDLEWFPKPGPRRADPEANKARTPAAGNRPPALRQPVPRQPPAPKRPWRR